MEPAASVDDLITQCLDHHRAYGRSPNTIYHYQDSFSLFRAYLAARATEGSTAARPDTSLRVGIHGVLKDFRAFVRWLQNEGLLTNPVSVPGCHITCSP